MNRKKVAILDYGIGNVKSICNAFEKIDAKPVLTADPELIKEADALVLPGVGAFAKGMENLNSYGLIPLIHEFINSGKPFIGICLGMQMLVDESEEFGINKGLGLIKGRVVRLPLPHNTNEKLPHIGWNELLEPNKGRWKDTTLHSLAEKTNVYFVHSYVVVPVDSEDILAASEYGGVKFCAALQCGNIHGVQFHPEKSGEEGLQILRKFIALPVKKLNNLCQGTKHTMGYP